MKKLLTLLAALCCEIARAQSAPPVALTAEQDQRRLLDLLHISALRPGEPARAELTQRA
jgi:hypothetical protein